MILATFSSVFRAMFFGPMRESKDVIPVRETTVEAFKKLIDYIYQVDIDIGGIELIEVFDLVNLAERYNVPELKEELKDQMELVPVALENLMEVATMAIKRLKKSSVDRSRETTSERYIKQLKSRNLLKLAPKVIKADKRSEDYSKKSRG